ncbi:MAG TPA: ABC transporter substrate-binding protein [Stellaceae bacterium]|nr:ABC transporter substrate-binding protein [Stellaceae bacterium]
MKRRAVLALLAGAAVASPFAGRAQKREVPVIGFLGGQSIEYYTIQLSGFRQGLKEAGFSEGDNVTIDYRWAQNDPNRLPALAADLVGRHVSLIATTGTTSAFAAKAATSTIPIVFEVGFDPVTVGLVENLNRPGGNLTGITNLSVEAGPKQLELLHELVPTASRIALLINPANETLAETLARDARAAARKLGLELHIVHASADRDFDAALAAVAQWHDGALMIGADSFFIARSDELGRLTAGHAIPASFYFREFAAAGGLISYGPSLREAHRLAGVYAGRILAGAKPADLPVQQATKLELVINLGAAKALHLEIPSSILARADEVIE